MDLSTIEALKDLVYRCWNLHSGQRKVLDIYLNTEADFIYVGCGRKFGKTELGICIAWLTALTRPKADVYYLTPEVQQSESIVWLSDRIFGGDCKEFNFVEEVEKVFNAPLKILQNKMLIKLPNGSIIKVGGSNNYQSQRGFRPDLVVADEYAWFEERWINIMRPNMSPKKGKMLFLSTPPETRNHSVRMIAECKLGMESGDRHYYYLEMPSSSNDRIPDHAAWLAREKKRLYDAGKGHEWEREYEAKFVEEGENLLIPQLTRKSMVPFGEILRELSRPLHEIEYYLLVDPGTTSQLGAILGAYDRSEGKLYCLDSFLVKDASKTSAMSAWLPVNNMYCSLPEAMRTSDPLIVVNPQTKWFSRDLADQFEVYSSSVDRAVNNPVFNVSVIKDLLIRKKLVISDKMLALVEEAETAVLGGNGKTSAVEILSLINCLRYLISASGYTSDQKPLSVAESEDEAFFGALTLSFSIEEAILREARKRRCEIDFD